MDVFCDELPEEELLLGLRRVVVGFGGEIMRVLSCH
jgi:hypothetical protein